MLSGELMEAGGISKRLVNIAKAFVGHITGGIGMVDIGTSVLFAGVSGSAAADTAADRFHADSVHAEKRLSEGACGGYPGMCRVSRPDYPAQPYHDYLLLP